jgi:hypothetical protein
MPYDVLRTSVNFLDEGSLLRPRFGGSIVGQMISALATDAAIIPGPCNHPVE